MLQVTVENGQDYVYGRGGKGRQLEVDTDDSPTLARIAAPAARIALSEAAHDPDNEVRYWVAEGCTLP